jgi:hypothetical protein
VTPQNGVASLDRSAWGAFTVGLEIEDEDAKLELNLSQLPDAVKFRSR